MDCYPEQIFNWRSIVCSINVDFLRKCGKTSRRSYYQVITYMNEKIELGSLLINKDRKIELFFFRLLHVRYLEWSEMGDKIW